MERYCKPASDFPEAGYDDRDDENVGDNDREGGSENRRNDDSDNYDANGDGSDGLVH